MFSGIKKRIYFPFLCAILLIAFRSIYAQHAVEFHRQNANISIQGLSQKPTFLLTTKVTKFSQRSQRNRIQCFNPLCALCVLCALSG